MRTSIAARGGPQRTVHFLLVTHERRRGTNRAQGTRTRKVTSQIDPHYYLLPTFEKNGFRVCGWFRCPLTSFVREPRPLRPMQHTKKAPTLVLLKRDDLENHSPTHVKHHVR
jgi:hypothetical protein